MTAIAPIPMVRFDYLVLTPARNFEGCMEVPDCDGALEQATRVAAQVYGVDLRQKHLFLFRKVENATGELQPPAEQPKI